MQWTEYQRSLERFLYLGGFEEKEVAEETNTPARQQSLFS